MNLDLNFLPKKIRTPLEIGQNIIKGVSKKDGGRIPYGRGYLVEGAKSKSVQTAKKYIAKAFRNLGKSINVGLGPTGILALNTALGTDPTQSLDRVGLGLEATFAKPLVSGATSVTDKIKNPMLRKVVERTVLAGMSPAMAMKIARAASPIGIASLAGEGLYQVGKLGYEDQKRFNALSPEEQAAERAEQEKFAFDIEGS
jgi:hypothetical protein